MKQSVGLLSFLRGQRRTRVHSTGRHEERGGGRAGEMHHAYARGGTSTSGGGRLLSTGSTSAAARACPPRVCGCARAHRESAVRCDCSPHLPRPYGTRRGTARHHHPPRATPIRPRLGALITRPLPRGDAGWTGGGGLALAAAGR